MSLAIAQDVPLLSGVGSTLQDTLFGLIFLSERTQWGAFMFKYSHNRRTVQSIKTMNWTARQLRYKPTEAEDKLWQRLRSKKLGYKFRRQHSIDNYIVDFFCFEQKLIIEVDGPIHLNHIEHDDVRDLFLQSLGYTVLHFTNQAVIETTDLVITRITSLLKGGGARRAEKV